jgi:hypothetical protein
MRHFLSGVKLFSRREFAESTNRKNELHFNRRVTCFASLATSDMGILCQLAGKSIPK